MRYRNRVVAITILILGAGVMLFVGYPSLRSALAQSPSTSESAKAKDVPIDQYDRVAQFWFYQRMGKSGWERGQEIYLMNCWICHNDYTIKADPRAAPTLRNLYKRTKLMAGQPVNDESVTAQIQRGSARMPGYAAVFNDADLADLLSYLREKCCWDEMNPPANPNYRAGK